MNLNVQIEKPSSILRKLTIRVPAATIERRFERSLAEAQRQAKVKGFRPGHVPLPIVKKMYGEDVRHRLFHTLIEEAYGEAIRGQNLKAVGQPRIETPDHKTGEGTHDHGVGEGEDLTFTATVEVIPEVEVKSYSGISLSRAKVEVTDQDVESVVRNLLESQAQLVPVQGGLLNADGSPSSREARKGDYVEIAFTGGVVNDDGSLTEKPGMKGTRTLEIGSDALIPGFEEQLVGMRASETKTFRVPFPEDFYEKELAGKPAEFTVTVNELKEKKLPELDDEFAKQLGYEGTADMRKKAREHLTRDRTQESERRLRSDLLKNLIDKNDFEVPAGLIQAQTRQLAQEVAGNLRNQGFNDQMIQDALAAEIENLKKRAENQVRASLILEAIAKKEDLSVSPEEADAEVSRMAISMKVDEPKIREFYRANPGRMEDLLFRMKEDKTVEFLLGKSKIRDEK